MGDQGPNHAVNSNAPFKVVVLVDVTGGTPVTLVHCAYT